MYKTNTEVNSRDFSTLLSEYWDKLSELRERYISDTITEKESANVLEILNSLVSLYKDNFSLKAKELKKTHALVLLIDFQNEIDSIINYGNVVFSITIERFKLELEQNYQAKWLVFCQDNNRYDIILSKLKNEIQCSPKYLDNVTYEYLECIFSQNNKSKQEIEFYLQESVSENKGTFYYVETEDDENLVRSLRTFINRDLDIDYLLKKPIVLEENFEKTQELKQSLNTTDLEEDITSLHSRLDNAVKIAVNCAELAFHGDPVWAKNKQNQFSKNFAADKHIITESPKNDRILKEYIHEAIPVDSRSVFSPQKIYKNLKLKFQEHQRSHTGNEHIMSTPYIIMFILGDSPQIIASLFLPEQNNYSSSSYPIIKNDFVHSKFPDANKQKSIREVF